MTKTENSLISKLSQNQRPARPSVLMIAKNVLDQNLRIEVGGQYFLWLLGRWAPVNLDDVMRAANRRLKADGMPQVTLNPRWKV